MDEERKTLDGLGDEERAMVVDATEIVRSLNGIGRRNYGDSKGGRKKKSFNKSSYQNEILYAMARTDKTSIFGWKGELRVVCMAVLAWLDGPRNGQ